MSVSFQSMPFGQTHRRVAAPPYCVCAARIESLFVQFELKRTEGKQKDCCYSTNVGADGSVIQGASIQV